MRSHYRKGYTRKDGTRVKGTHVRGNSTGWIQAVNKEMNKNKTVGSFTAKANRHGKSVHNYAVQVMKNYRKISKPTKSQIHLMRQASLALTFEKMAKRR